jgi:hypothetical protein
LLIAQTLSSQAEGVGRASGKTIVTEITYDSLSLDWTPLCDTLPDCKANFKVMLSGLEYYSGSDTKAVLQNLAPATDYTVSILVQLPAHTRTNGDKVKSREKKLVVVYVTTLPIRPLEVSESERDRRCRAIREFAPDFAADLGLRNVNIMQVGPIGAGKTSVCQAIVTAITKSDYPYHVGGINCVDEHVTRCFARHELRNYGIPIPVEYRDTVGCDATNYANDERTLMLDGKLPFGWKVGEPASANDGPMWHDAKFCDAVHVLLIVLPANQVRNVEQARENVAPYKPWMEAARARGIPTIIVLTKLDLLDVSIAKDPARIVASSIVDKVCHIVSTVFGLQGNCVFPIKNYQDEPESVLAIDIRALMLMQRILSAANNYYARVRNALMGGEVINCQPVGPSVLDPHGRYKRAKQQQQDRQ